MRTVCAISDKVMFECLNSSDWHRKMSELNGDGSLIPEAAKFIRSQTGVDTPVKVVANRLARLVDTGMLEERGGRLVLTNAAFEQHFGRKFNKRPASLARLDSEGADTDTGAIYEYSRVGCVDDDQQTCFGADRASEDQWRQELASLWLTLAPIEDVIAFVSQGGPEIQYYGFPQELASLEQDGGGIHFVAAPPCA